ncbi:MAG: hypothetical protein O3B13_14280 [Planctomycetota bacterium]|nr:hypothetical protein [Planctomycetota bacterium]MDA1164262.1 hypothetical protein [Planctomycetota bacterium]
MTISESLREQVNMAIDSGITFAALERGTGILRQSLMKFARGQQSLRLDRADLLATFFELELQPVKSKKRKA